MFNGLNIKQHGLHHDNDTDPYPMDFYEISKISSLNHPKTIQTLFPYIWIHLMVHVVMSYVQVRNINISLRLVIAQPRAFARWCCLIPSILCIGISVLTIMFQLGKYFYIDRLMLYAGWAIPISILCYSAILLQKAYIMSHKNRWILVIGIILIILQIATPVMLFNVAVIVNIDFYRRGHIYYPKIWTSIWFFTSLIVNLFLSSVFSYMAYKQYCTFGSKTWKCLASDGIQFMCLVIICNTICSAIMYVDIFPNLGMLFYFIDW
ncbi:hypothetical protein BDF19DRAFT_179179 [Syncephalis fuscata]|nr:hypothetical protein BDF19DRAFT_179179 [Syncephalis fuscata]